jgi:hypothetical protein
LSDLPQVRVATPADEEEIMILVRELHGENGLFSLNEQKVRENLHKCFERKGAIVGVIGEAGKIEASTCLLFSEMYYTDEWHIAELWNHVAVPYRNSRNLEALIAFGKKCSNVIGLPLITGVITNKRVEGKVRLYRKLLGYPAGAFFVYNGKWSANVQPSVEDFWRPFEGRTEARKRLRREAAISGKVT